VHAARLYGNTSVKNLRYIRPHIKLLKPRSVLDFGCGQSTLLQALEFGPNVQTVRHDPAIPEFSAEPVGRFDLLINIDVLEHIPENDLPTLLETMRGLAREALFIVDTEPASMILPNGENAHCTLHSHSWWNAMLARFFPRLVPIRVARRSRAAFRTWQLSPSQAAVLRAMRVAEDARYWSRRAVTGKIKQ
jgi:hypothetical protein